MKTYLLFLSILLSFFFNACSPRPYAYSIKSAEEFVIDSYQIRQGKLSILSLEGIELSPLPKDAMEEYQETIADGDILNIAIYHPERNELISDVSQINNSIGFKVINGEIVIPELETAYISGLTLEEARLKLQELYNKEIQDIEVFISFNNRTIRNIELAGKVAISTIPVDGKLRLFDALSIAKIPTTSNLFKSYIVREGNLLPIDLTKLIKKGDMSQNIVMHAGDKLYIADTFESTVMIMGEVGQPQPVPVPDGSISLREALVYAGGIPFTGNKNYIQIIRGNINNPKIYVLNWNHIVHLPNHSLLLMPGDVVYISAKPITEWNRFINQLLPSLGGLTSAYGAYKVVGGV